MLLVFLLISGKFLDVNYIHILDHSISNIYQNPKGFLFASLIGYGINFIFMIIIRLADWLENTLSIVIDCLIIFLIFLLLYNGKNKTIESRIAYCQSQKNTQCIVQNDDNIFIAIKANWESGTVDLKDPIELKFWNYKVKQGDYLYTTNESYTKKKVTYIEVYNDSIWGYIREDNIIKEE